MKAECIYSPECHPAASGRGITLATMNKRGLIQKQTRARLLARWLTATQAGFTTLLLLRYIAAFVFVCVFLLGWQISPHYYEVFIKSKKAWIGTRMLISNIFFPKFSVNFSKMQEVLQLKINCLLDVGTQIFVLQPVQLFLLLALLGWEEFHLVYIFVS